MAQDQIKHPCQLLLIGGSAGSLDVLLKVFPNLDSQLAVPIVIVLHRRSSSDSSLADLLGTRTLLRVRDIEDKQPLKPNHVYVAPPDYHLLFEKNGVMSLDYSEKVNYSRPSLDVTFESASDVFGPALTCLLLSGANADGVAGLAIAKERGGRIVVQDPASAETPFMPAQAIARVKVDAILKIEDMAPFINSL